MTSGSYRRECPQCRAAFFGLEDFCPNDGTPLTASPSHKGQAAGAPQGEIIDRRFALLKLLGKGAMGEVYLARHLVLGRLFALKLLRRELLGDKMVLRRFQREARAASTVVHPHVVNVYDYGQTPDGRAYLAMEYVDGISLHQLLKKSTGGCLNINRAIDITIQITQALNASHTHGIVHRDIKPENVLLTQKAGQADFVKVADFGVARLLTEQRMTADGCILGTAEFIAPEMLAGSPVGPPADLYAIGILMHELIIGSAPFTGSIQTILANKISQNVPTLSSRRRDIPVPKELDDFVITLLDKDPARRPTAGEATSRLMELRPQVPPLSMRSHVVLDTIQIAARPPTPQPTPRLDAALTEADTLRLDEERQDLLRTLELPPLLREMDQVDFEMGRASQQVERLTVALIKRRWPERLPGNIVKRYRHVESCEHANEELGMQMALRREEAEQAERVADAQRAEIRAQMLTIRDAISALPPDSTDREDERHMLYRGLLQYERAYAEVMLDGKAAAEVAKLRPQLQELHNELQRARRDLAVAVLKRCNQDHETAPLDATTLFACKELSHAIADFDGLASAMTLLLERIPRLTPPPVSRS